MLRRILDQELDDLFGQVPAIAIDGPKAVGKTTTGEQRVQGGSLHAGCQPSAGRCRGRSERLPHPAKVRILTTGRANGSVWTFG